MVEWKQSFPRWLNGILERRGLIPSQLAAYLELSDEAISKWRHGETRPSAESCVKLADYLHIPVTRVLVQAGYLPPGAEEVDLRAVDYRDAIRHQFPDEEADTIIRVAEALLAQRRLRDEERRQRNSSGQ